MSGAPQRTVAEERQFQWKICYSTGVTHHGENMRRLLNLEHYIPSLHLYAPVWFFGLYFDSDYHQLLAHQGRKIVNWRGSDANHLRGKPQRIQVVRNTTALHVCQSSRQQDVLSELGIPSIVRPMLNGPVDEIRVTPFPSGQTAVLIFWPRGVDHFIQADLFFRVAALCPQVVFHIVGNEDPARFSGTGMANLVFHGYLSEEDLNRLMDRCKGTIRPWRSDGTPNIQTRMLLRGRYAAHSLAFEKVSLCRSVDEYVKWIHRLQNITESNLEAREWWLRHLNNFDFLEIGLHPDQYETKTGRELCHDGKARTESTLSAVERTGAIYRMGPA